MKKILKLKKELEELKEYWLNISYFEGALISVTYVDVVAKSRRMRELFKKIVEFNQMIALLEPNLLIKLLQRSNMLLLIT